MDKTCLRGDLVCGEGEAAAFSGLLRELSTRNNEENAQEQTRNLPFIGVLSPNTCRFPFKSFKFDFKVEAEAAGKIKSEGRAFSLVVS